MTQAPAAVTPADSERKIRRIIWVVLGAAVATGMSWYAARCANSPPTATRTRLTTQTARRGLIDSAMLVHSNYRAGRFVTQRFVTRREGRRGGASAPPGAALRQLRSPLLVHAVDDETSVLHGDAGEVERVGKVGER